MSTEVDEVLDRLSALVEQARAVPMSASCVVNRDEVLTLLDDARATLPSALARAERVLRERQSLLAGAEEQADDVVAQAHAEQARLLEATAVFGRAQTEADRLLSAARADAETLRLQTDDYVDAKLADFEVVLATTLATVERGRSRLAGRDDSRLAGRDDSRDDSRDDGSSDHDDLRGDGRSTRRDGHEPIARAHQDALGRRG